MADGSGAYKWHEWKRSFPRIMRGPRGVGFQENADCFPALFLPSYQFSIRLSSPSAFPILPLYQSSTSSAAEMYKSPPPPPPSDHFIRIRACVRLHDVLLRYRHLNTPLSRGTSVPFSLFVRVPRKNRTCGDVCSSVLLPDDSFRFEKCDYR